MNDASSKPETRQFFVLSSGRSGSQTVSHTLTQSPSCLCLHEPHPQLVKESAQFAYRYAGHDPLAALIRRTRDALGAGVATYGETNNRLALVAEPLLAAYPSAKFVWLLRDGRDFVASEVQRGAYDPQAKPPWAVSKWDRWRVAGDKCGVVSPETWSEWDVFERACWQWSWVNERIRSFVLGLPVDQWRVCRIEEFAGEVSRLGDWLDLEPVNYLVPRSNRRRAGDDPDGTDRSVPNNVDEVATWDDWTLEQRATFERHCSWLMDQHYRGWRNSSGVWVSMAWPEVPGVDSVSTQQLELARLSVANVELESQLSHLHTDVGGLALRLGGAVRASVLERFDRR